MRDFIKIFIRELKMEKTKNKRAFLGRLAGIVGIIVNILLAVGKIGVGVIFGVLSVTADGINNLTDCGSSVISTVSFKLSEKPADKEHPFGHGRIEYILSMVVAFIIFFVAFETVKEAVGKIIQPVGIVISIWIPIMLGVSIVAKIGLFIYYRIVAKKIDSTILKASATDSLSDCVSTFMVLVCFFITYFTGYNVDGYAGVLVALFIGYSAFGILKEVVSTLIGKAPDEKLVNKIKDKIRSYPDVLGVHDLLVYNYGPNKYFASAHIEVDANVDVLQSHELVDLIEKEFIQDEGIVFTGHLDPIVTDNEKVSELKIKVENIVCEIDERLTIHDFRMVFGENRTNVLFDVLVPYGFNKSKTEIVDYITNKVKLIDERYYLVITVEPGI
ncbi:MAG: cation transporter [Clostridiales bacterium]|nr:cation transporter [Clostridiales bacterium]